MVRVRRTVGRLLRTGRHHIANDLDALGWDDFRLVRAVAQAGSLPAAAERLGVNHSTVFRRLRQIEDALASPLFERDRTKLVATAFGEELVALAERIGGEIDAATLKRAGREPEPEGEVRVATNDSLLVHLLTPMFAAFRASYPRIRLDVVIANAATNLSRRDADVAVRATDRAPDTLVGRVAARIAWASYGRRGTTGEAEPSKNVGPDAWVGLGDSMGAMKVTKHALAQAGSDRLAYRVDSVLGLAAAVEAGLGIGHLPCFIGDIKPVLVRLGPPDPAFATDLWLLTHPDLRRTPRVRALLDVLGREIAKRRNLVEGRVPSSR